LESTLKLIATSGVFSAAVRPIVDVVNVTHGLIGHSFSTKQGPVASAFEYHIETIIGFAITCAEVVWDLLTNITSAAGSITAALDALLIEFDGRRPLVCKAIGAARERAASWDKG
jgi:hypothetical protein